MTSFIPQGMGWIPDLPDARDYTYRHEAILPLLQRLKRSGCEEPPEEFDLCSDEEGEYFAPPEDQGSLDCSAAFAVLSLFEYYERRVYGHTFEGSKLFLYKVTRNRLQNRTNADQGPPDSHSSGDTGADLRTTLKVAVQFGAPPEEHWPYDTEKFDEEPSPFLYSLAKPPAGVRYFRLDEPNRDGPATWENVKSFLTAGFPVAFGFPVPASLTVEADIPYRPKLDRLRGGQAAVAVGFRNNHFGRGQHALRIRSSWGTQWGNNGNGLLPVGFVRKQLARDFWTLVNEDWLDSCEMSRPNVIDLA